MVLTSQNRQVSLEQVFGLQRAKRTEREENLSLVDGSSCRGKESTDRKKEGPALEDKK